MVSNRRLIASTGNIRIILLILLVFVTACSQQTGNGEAGQASPLVSYKGNSVNALMPANFDNNAWQTDSQFISNNHTAERVSIIDSASESEVKNWHKSNTPIVVALPGIEGAAFISPDKLLIKTQSYDKSFTLQKPYRHIARVNRQTVFSFASVDGLSIELIRYVGGDQWQQVTVDMPWRDDAQAMSAPISLITQFSSNGHFLAVLDTLRGLYTVFALYSSIGSPIEPVLNWCHPDTSAVTSAGVSYPKYLSLNWDYEDLLSRGIGFVGDVDGRLSAFQVSSFDFENVCSDTLPSETRNLGPDNTALDSYQFPSVAPLTNITLYPDQSLMRGFEYRLGVLQNPVDGNALLHVIKYDFGGKFYELEYTVSDICRSAIASTLIRTGYILVTCAGNIRTSQAEKNLALSPESSWITNGAVDPQVYVLINANTGEILQRLSLRDSSLGYTVASGYTINRSTLQLYRMQEGVFGDLLVADLLTGNLRISNHIFLDNILQ